MSTFIDDMQVLADAEHKFVAVVQQLVSLHSANALQWTDVLIYNRLRAELYAAQLTAWGIYALKVRGYLPAQAAAQIPVPLLAPNFPLLPNYGVGTPTAPTTPTVAGLGFAPIVIAAGGVSITISLFAVVVLAVIAAAIVGAAIVAIVYAVLGSEENANAAARAQQDAAAEQQFYAARLACMQAGRSVADCTASVPAPADVRPYDTTPPPSQTWLTYAAWGAGGLAFVVLALGWMRYMGGSVGGQGKTPRVYVVE